MFVLEWGHWAAHKSTRSLLLALEAQGPHLIYTVISREPKLVLGIELKQVPEGKWLGPCTISLTSEILMSATHYDKDKVKMSLQVSFSSASGGVRGHKGQESPTPTQRKKPSLKKNRTSCGSCRMNKSWADNTRVPCLVMAECKHWFFYQFRSSSGQFLIPKTISSESFVLWFSILVEIFIAWGGCWKPEQVDFLGLGFWTFTDFLSRTAASWLVHLVSLY